MNPFGDQWRECLAESYKLAWVTGDNLPHTERIMREAGATDEDLRALQRAADAEGESLVARVQAQQPTPHLMDGTHV